MINRGERKEKQQEKILRYSYSVDKQQLNPLSYLHLIIHVLLCLRLLCNRQGRRSYLQKLAVVVLPALFYPPLPMGWQLRPNLLHFPFPFHFFHSFEFISVLLHDIVAAISLNSSCSISVVTLCPPLSPLIKIHSVT